MVLWTCMAPLLVSMLNFTGVNSTWPVPVPNLFVKAFGFLWKAPKEARPKPVPKAGREWVHSRLKPKNGIQVERFFIWVNFSKLTCSQWRIFLVVYIFCQQRSIVYLVKFAGACFTFRHFPFFLETFETFKKADSQTFRILTRDFLSTKVVRMWHKKQPEKKRKIVKIQQVERLTCRFP